MPRPQPHQTKVVNLHHYPSTDPRLVPIDRQTRWGNPFRIKGPWKRTDVINLYASWIRQEIRDGRFTRHDLAQLHGKTLACWCAPQPCHGLVLAQAAKAATGSHTDWKTWMASELPVYPPNPEIAAVK